MIILKHLTIERFRLLRSMNLHFPQRGSILIQGPNEAGKSALIESLYFALYGEPLVPSRGKRSLDDLILYGSSSAQVVLTLSVGATELTIERTLERGQSQQVSLQIRRLGMPDEAPVTDLEVANARIVAEMGEMDGEALRNTCLIEQKGLNRLETISGAQREVTVRKLLGLEKLQLLQERFHIEEQDERKLHESSERLRLAEIQVRIPQLSEQLDSIEAALDAVSVHEALAEIEQQEAEISELERVLEQGHSRSLELKSQQGRIQQLKKAEATLDSIISSYDDIADAQRRLPELENSIADLERREREELPRLEKRVNELAELTRSFGTLQRMSNDLLSAVDSIKELEQDLKQYNHVKQDLRLLDEQITHARLRLTKAQQSLQEIEEKRRTLRPQLEARLERLRALAESLRTLHQLEEQYTQKLASRSQAEENGLQLQKVRQDLRDTEQEFELVEREAQQTQQQADTLEGTWRQYNVRRQIEEWQRLKGLAQGLADAEQHVHVARQRQAQLTQSVIEARNTATRYLMYTIGCVVAVALCIVIALTSLTSVSVLAIIAIIVAIAAAGLAAYLFASYRKAHVQELEARQKEQEAISRVGMMVTAREAAQRMSGDQQALVQVENEIRSLGGSVPHSLDDAQQFLQRTPKQDDLGELQQHMKERLDAANAARNQVNVTMEAVASLRNERARLEELRKQERWDNLDEDLHSNQAAIERMQQEVTLLAGQENLPSPSINARLQQSPITTNPSYSSGALPPVSDEDISGIPDLETLVDTTVKATEHEIAALDGKLDVMNDLASQTRIHQEALDVLLQRQHTIEEQNARFLSDNPEVLLERAREQQTALRSALQSLQDSLRQRVKPLGVAFGQAAINQAETTARKQLEELHITLGNKIMLQEQHTRLTELLKERQESLSEYYKQLAKFSNTLGSWIVPLNPFAEALIALRSRCQRELEEANEQGIQHEFDDLRNRERAAQAKIALCQQDIADAQAAIAEQLDQRGRPQPKSYFLADLTAIWPLLAKYTLTDRQHLVEQRFSLEKELNTLEKQELEMSQALHLENQLLNLEEAHTQMEAQERSYQTKKYGNEMLKAVNERLLRKMLPRTESYMQQIVPLLTAGRYRDVHLQVEPEEGTIGGGSYQIQVWDSAANEYVPSSTLSGGAADQLALALRLAFAIATLPRELGAAPGFVLLDEPLSSFDRGRAQALVDVVTGEVLAEHFEQILLFSHSSAFDPALFPYHIYIDNGLVVESNLPVVTVPSPVSAASIEPFEIGETPQPIAVGAPMAGEEG